MGGPEPRIAHQPSGQRSKYLSWATVGRRRDPCTPFDAPASGIRSRNARIVSGHFWVGICLAAAPTSLVSPQWSVGRSYTPTDESPRLETCGDARQGRVVSGTVVGRAVMAILTVGPALVQFDILCPSKATDIEGGGTLQRGTVLSSELTLQVTFTSEIL